MKALETVITRARNQPRSRLLAEDSSAGAAAKLKLRSWAVVVLVAGLLVFHQLSLQPVLTQLDHDAPTINVAGRQRMLSQKLSKSALALQAAQDPAERSKRRDELAAVVSEWSHAHHALQNGDRRLRLPANDDPDIRAAYLRLEPHFQAIVRATQTLLTGSPRTGLSPVQQAAIQTIMQHEDAFLTQMHELVGLHAASSRSHVWRLQALGWGIVASIMALLLLIQALVIRPAMNVVGNRLALWEAQYRRLVESMSEGLVVHDSEGRIQLANRRFCELVGLHVDDVLGQPVTRFISETHRNRYDGLLTNPLTPRAPAELALQGVSGDIIETMASLQTLADHAGGQDVVLLVVTDMTAYKQSEKKSRELLDQLSHANRLKSMGELAAGLAHELNQPLAAIANFAEAGLASLSDESPSGENLQIPLKRILSAALRGGEIVRRARRFSQRVTHELRPESLNELVREVEQLFRHEALRRNVTLELELTAALPLLCLDGIQIQQVLANLIQNAFIAMESSGSERRRLRITTAVESPDFVRVTVSDTGPGFAADAATRLFEPFFTTSGEGLGLGLAIAQNIVEGHGGTIAAFNNDGTDGGATFSFTLATQPSLTDGECFAIKEEVAHV